MNFRQEGETVMGENRRRPLHRARTELADALEPRMLLSQTIDLPLVNPGFDTLYKPGSTSITARIPDVTATEGFGTNFPVEQLSDLKLATVSYSDGTTGTNVTVPGWMVVPIEHGPSYRPVAGIVKDSPGYPGKTDNFASIFFTPDLSRNSTQIRQTLVGTTLLPNSRYILSADVAEGGALSLKAGATFLSTGRIKATAKNEAGFKRVTKTYVTKANVAAGDITVVLGSGGDFGGNSTGDFDNISLQLVSSGTTPTPSPTPTPLPFGASSGHGKNLKLTQADGTIVTVSMTGGSGFATQDGGQIDLQITSSSVKTSNLTITARLGSGSFTLGNVTVSGSLNRVTAPTGMLAGAMAVDGAIGSMSLGSISGTISAGSIGTIQAGAVTGEVYSAGSISSLKLGAVSGTLDAAGTIGTVSAASLTVSTILSGVNLGAAGATPAATSAALSYGAGSIGTLAVRGSVTVGTVVAAAADPVDGVFANGDDTAAGAGQIGSISIRGLADAGTRFEAPAFGRVKIRGGPVTNVISDPRFVTL